MRAWRCSASTRPASVCEVSSATRSASSARSCSRAGDLGPEIVEESFVSNGLGGQLVLADAGTVELALEGLDPLVTGAEFGDLGVVACRAHRGLHGGELSAER